LAARLPVTPPAGHGRSGTVPCGFEGQQERRRSKRGKKGEPLEPRPEPSLHPDQRAKEILTDPELGRLLTAPREVREIERARQIFVNRNLRMSNVELVGFDMDYTLAIYHVRRIEQLSFDMTLARLVAERGYPEA